MKLIVGLGNPGKEYEATRHNLGFMVVDALAKALGLSFRKKTDWQAMIAEGHSHGNKVILIKPQNFMNRSGEVVTAVADYYHVRSNDIWVISDELDLPLGKVRIRDTGASAGHNGVQSIIDTLKAGDFYRIRLGIGQSDQVISEPEASVLVLQSFTPREKKIVDSIVAEITIVLRQALTDNRLMTRSFTNKAIPA